MGNRQFLGQLAFALLIGLHPAVNYGFGTFGTYGTWPVGAYEIRLSEEKGELTEDLLQVSQGGKVIFELRDTGLCINPPEILPNGRNGAKEDEGEESKELEALLPSMETGKTYALTGRKRESILDTGVLGLAYPAIVVEGFSGGAHCCTSFHVLILGPTFRAIDPVFAGSSGEIAQFIIDNTGHSLILEVADPSWEYWECSFVDSPFPPVRLRLNVDGNKFEADSSLMHTLLPTRSKLHEAAMKAKEEHKESLTTRGIGVPGCFANEVFTLIYGGHLTTAKEFLDDAWAGTIESKEKYWTKVRDALTKQTPYWPAVADVNGIRISDGERFLRRHFPQEE